MPDVEITRQVDPSAKVAPDAKVSAYCVIGPNVTIGPGTVLRRRVCVRGHTTIGSENIFAEGCVIGDEPQDLKYAGGPTLLIIGHRNRFGRNTTVHVGTETGGHLTHIGDDNVFQQGCHIAHDCYVHDKSYFGRNVLVAGHICVETGAVVEDHAGIHQFSTIGRYCRIGPCTPVRRDIPPYIDFYCDQTGKSPAVRGVHEAGIKAAQLAPDEEKELRHILGELFDDDTALETKIEQLEKLGVEGEAAAVCEFCRRSLRGVYGRYRELFRGGAPPEAELFLPPQQLADIRRSLS